VKFQDLEQAVPEGVVRFHGGILDNKLATSSALGWVWAGQSLDACSGMPVVADDIGGG
jgi:hypothetical protein